MDGGVEDDDGDYDIFFVQLPWSTISLLPDFPTDACRQAKRFSVGAMYRKCTDAATMLAWTVIRLCD